MLVHHESDLDFAARRVLVVGVGGLGSSAALALARAEVGTLGLMDPDPVEVSNLHRQLLYDSADVGRPKVTVAAEQLRRLMPGLHVESRRERFGPHQAAVLRGFHPRTLRALERYAWPGNVRQLANEIHRLVLCAEPGEWIMPELLASWIVEDTTAPADGARALKEIVREVELATILARLREHGYHRSATARSLGMTRESLWAKLRLLGFVPPRKSGVDDAN